MYTTAFVSGLLSTPSLQWPEAPLATRRKSPAVLVQASKRSTILSMTAAESPHAVSRRALLKSVAASLSSLLLLRSLPSNAAVIDPSKEPLLAIIQSINMLKPVQEYIQNGQWDKARTNINFCTRQLRLKTAMKLVADTLDEEAFYDAADIMGEMDNLMTQLDATVYTPIFIPADREAVPPEAKKYQGQALDYHKKACTLLEKFVALVPADQREAAIKKAEKNPIRFREYS